MYHPSQEMAQLTKVPQIENGKPDFSPTFQKAKLRNSTFSNYGPKLLDLKLGSGGGFGKKQNCAENHSKFPT